MEGPGTGVRAFSAGHFPPWPVLPAATGREEGCWRLPHAPPSLFPTFLLAEAGPPGRRRNSPPAQEGERGGRAGRRELRAGGRLSSASSARKGLPLPFPPLPQPGREGRTAGKRGPDRVGRMCPLPSLPALGDAALGHQTHLGSARDLVSLSFLLCEMEIGDPPP